MEVRCPEGKRYIDDDEEEEETNPLSLLRKRQFTDNKGKCGGEP